MALSVVIPVYNEEENLRALHAELHAALVDVKEWEAVFVDDGSRDGSMAVLRELASEDASHVTVVNLRRNFGQTAAVAAGIEYSGGDVIVLIDADLQNDPADIPMLIAKLDEGFDVVCGWRQRRQDTFITRTLPSMMANALISRITGVRLHDYGCSLKAFRRETLESISLYGEMHRFIPAYAAMVGSSILEAPVSHRPRLHGKTKYGLGRTWKVLIDLCTVNMYLRYSSKPGYLFGKWGGLALLMCLGGLVVAGFDQAQRQGLSPWWLIALIFGVMGAQSIWLGLLAEMMMRTYYAARKIPPYTVRSVIREEGRHGAGQNAPGRIRRASSSR